MARRFSMWFLAGVTGLMFPVAAHATTILVDFGLGGSTTTATGWNNIAAFNQIGVAMVDSTGAPTSITLDETGYASANNTGLANGALVTGSPSGTPYPSTATSDFFNTGTDTGTVVFNGLGTGTYSLSILASRAVAATDSSRIGNYTVNGVSHQIDAAGGGPGNTAVYTFTNITPIAGAITLTQSGIASFSYINVLELNSTPEPASLSLLAVGGVTALRRRRVV